MNPMQAMPRKLLIAVLATLGMVPAASGQAYKCKAADGSVTYQDTPCRAGSSESVVDVPEPRPVSPEDAAAMEKAREDLRERDRELADRLERERLARLQREAEEQARYAASSPAAPTVVYPDELGVWRAGVYFPPYYGAPTFPIRPGRHPGRGWPPPFDPDHGHRPPPGHDGRGDHHGHQPRQSLGAGRDGSRGGGSLEMRR
jgi:hypothetical protein